MDEPFTRALIIKPARSRYLAVFIFAVHLGAMGTVFWSGLPATFAVGAAILILGALVRTLRVWWFDFDRMQEYAFVLSAAGGWLRYASGCHTLALVASPPVFVHPVLIVVRLRSCSRPVIRHDLILLPDNLDAATLRRLRVRLRLPP